MTYYSMVDIIIMIVGSPQNDIESLLIYLAACCISVLMIFYVLYIFKLIAQFSRVGGR